MRILVVEDDAQTAKIVCQCLEKEGHAVELASDGPNGLKLAVVGSFDVLVLDRMLPGLDGLSILQRLRDAEVHSAVLFLTAVGGIDDRISGFNTGCDDYLVKPFALGELLARVTALGRRPPRPLQDLQFKIGDLDVNMLKREARRGGILLELRPREFRILEILLKNTGRVVTRSMLLEQVWGLDVDPRTSIVQTNISRLRMKVDRPGDVPLIRTVRGVGYLIDEPN